jgi:hypothetical protein
MKGWRGGGPRTAALNCLEDECLRRVLSLSAPAVLVDYATLF